MEIKNYCATKYILGSGSLETLSQYKGKKVAFVVDENIIRALNLEQRLYQEILAGVDYRVICSITHEPTMAELEAPIRTVQEYQPDYIVGIGGGSVMDSAKVLWLFYELPHYDWARAMVPYGVDPFPGKAQMIAVPTTSGTGSETTCCAMVKDSENLKKMILSFEIVPTVAIMDFDLLKSLPPRNVAYSGTDALAHALGAAVSKPASSLVRGRGSSGFRHAGEKSSRFCGGQSGCQRGCPHCRHPGRSGHQQFHDRSGARHGQSRRGIQSSSRSGFGSYAPLCHALADSQSCLRGIGQPA